ncbi:hypothetical protein C8N36_105253 [Pelagimonas varians]|uniref:Uncharacterized protein n=1 Tax=Pelagimonas varians TaxID=696760 RepID=A0A238KAG9_9RHOB|nr:hypothetical protein C8N36_105253 [Pelagimonas varians]SMX39823.1 hypothetical protein PEV8663_01893 [Pelagimonas varians]
MLQSPRQPINVDSLMRLVKRTKSHKAVTVDTHTDSQKQSTDFAMPFGTPIHAARGGRVVFLKASSNKGGNSRYLVDQANYIAIQHDDRTLGL